MKSTSADDAIIQALWPGPDVVVSAFGCELVTYASRSATRVARSAGGGVAAGGAAAAGAGAAGAAGAAVWAKPEPSATVMTASAPAIPMITFRLLACFMGLDPFVASGVPATQSNANAGIHCPTIGPRSPGH